MSYQPLAGWCGKSIEQNLHSKATTLAYGQKTAHMGQRLTVWAYILPDMSMRGPRSEGNISPRAAAMLVCSSPFLLRLPSSMSASLSGKQGLALQHGQTLSTATWSMSASLRGKQGFALQHGQTLSTATWSMSASSSGKQGLALQHRVPLSIQLLPC